VEHKDTALMTSKRRPWTTRSGADGGAGATSPGVDNYRYDAPPYSHSMEVAFWLHLACLRQWHVAADD
jgi:hypothetical protein